MATLENPFPGMNPYLEQYWGDVHASLVTYLCDDLQESLPEDLRARMDERCYLESDVPDASTAEPLTESYIEVRERRTNNGLVTLIEVISPGNKDGGEGEQSYLAKQSKARAVCANVVEIDLIRGGHHIMTAPWQPLSRVHAAPYRVCVTRGLQADRSEWYPIHLRDRLPAIGIPLRTTDADVALDLQPILQRAYRMGRYDDIDYSREPNLSLDPTDAAWADGLLKSKGLRR